MHTMSELKRAARRAEVPEGATTVVVLGDSATQLLATAMRGEAALEGVPLRVVDTDYDQIDLQVADPASELHACGARYALLWPCVEKLWLRWCDTPLAERESFADRELGRVLGWWRGIASAGCRVLHVTYADLEDGAYGGYGLKVPASFAHQKARLDWLLAEAMAADGNVLPVDLRAVQVRLGSEAVRSQKLWEGMRVAVSPAGLPALASEAVRTVAAAEGRVRKCVVCDLDGTLWGGVVGDDGVGGIQVGELGEGRAFSDLQRWLRELERRGVLLAVCSKNEEAAARAPFESHPDMVLRLEDFAMFVANWEDKPSNIRLIRQTLDIGMDSLVFLDDNPFEREAVRAMLPEVAVPELPDDPAERLPFLMSSGLFQAASASAGDAGRTAQYRAEAGRREAAAEFSDYGDYLASLQMVGAARPFDEFSAPRVAQLTQRSNQFNLRTVRYTEADVLRMAADSHYATRCLMLRDRFGDHGIVGVVVLELRGEEAFVDTWLMSCRVLRRGMEEFTANAVVTAAREAGCSRVVGEYLPTAKNAMVSDLYPRMGFSDAGGGRWVADVASWQDRDHHIQKED